ncbi:MAG: hypothetical protein ACREQJ_12230 [Candidatus Binatia bacterium]
MTLISRVGAIFLFAPVLLLLASLASLTASPDAARRASARNAEVPLAGGSSTALVRLAQ